jgi:pimeloyl-ACP methyl ester carboxylesterase
MGRMHCRQSGDPTLEWSLIMDIQGGSRVYPLGQGHLSFEAAGAGAPVVFLHGFSLDSRVWTPQCDALRSRYRVIRYDLRGFGLSSAVPDTAYAHEDDLASLLGELRATPAHVVGHSMGGRMALRFASAYPGAVRSLALVASALDGHEWSEDWRSRWSHICTAAKAGMLAEARRQWFEHPLFESARASSTGASLLARMIDDYSGRHWQITDPARVPSPPLAERLAEIRVPALVVMGERDLPDFHRGADRLIKGLPAARYLQIPGAGHMVNLEAPQEVNAALVTFWENQRETSASHTVA